VTGDRKRGITYDDVAARILIGRRLAVYIDLDDWWVGAYIGPDAVYVCPLPTLVFRWARRPR
jgi:hypothetical protein